MASQFSDYYKRSAAIHEMISAMLKARPGQALDLAELTQRIREQHPDIGMAPTDLAKAIMRAAQDAGIRLPGPTFLKSRIGNLHLTPPLNVGD